MSFLSRLKIKIRDSLYYSRWVRRLAARALLMRTRRAGPDSGTRELVRSIATLCRVARLRYPAASERVEAAIRNRVSLTADRHIDWSTLVPFWEAHRIEKAVVLKPWLGEREKGVVFVSFEFQWARLMGIPNLLDFARRYTLVMAPTWSPPHALANTLLCAQYPDDQLFSLISNASDIKTFPRLSSKIRVVPLYASNWVSPDLYTPVPFARKDIDIVMLAGFAAYKRHFALFQALRELPSSLRVVLVGGPWGRDGSALQEEARQYGVQDRFELKQSATDEVVSQCLARAKISLILSRQEGSCVAVVESMFADTPVGIYEDAVIGSRVFINSYTGLFLHRVGLAAQLQEFLAAAGSYSPRKWALENGIDCHSSTRELNRILKESALAAGQQWTQDIAVHHWRPNPVLLVQEDRERLRPAREDIRLRYGVTIGEL
jgi:glycosyltransferase involved in cell wall biosynthesis